MPQEMNENEARRARILELLGTFTAWPKPEGGMTVAEVLDALKAHPGDLHVPARRTILRDLKILGGPRGPAFDENAKPAAPNARQKQVLADLKPDVVVHSERLVWWAGGNPRYFGYRSDRGAALAEDFETFADRALAPYAAALLPPEAARKHEADLVARERATKGTAIAFERWRKRVADRAMLRHAALAIDAGVREAVYLALYRSKQLSFEYASRAGAPTKAHTVQPLGLVLDIGRTTLVACAVGAKNDAVYKYHLHRMRSAVALDEPVDAACDARFDMGRYLASGDVDFPVKRRDERIEIEAVLLSPDVSRGIVEDEPLGDNQVIAEEADGALVVRAEAVDTWALRRKLLTYLPYVVFRKPSPLVPPYDPLDRGRARHAGEVDAQRLFAPATDARTGGEGGRSA